MLDDLYGTIIRKINGDLRRVEELKVLKDGKLTNLVLSLFVSIHIILVYHIIQPHM